MMHVPVHKRLVNHEFYHVLQDICCTAIKILHKLSFTVDWNNRFIWILIWCHKTGADKHFFVLFFLFPLWFKTWLSGTQHAHFSLDNNWLLFVFGRPNAVLKDKLLHALVCPDFTSWSSTTCSLFPLSAVPIKLHSRATALNNKWSAFYPRSTHTFNLAFYLPCTRPIVVSVAPQWNARFLSSCLTNWSQSSVSSAWCWVLSDGELYCEVAVVVAAQEVAGGGWRASLRGRGLSLLRGRRINALSCNYVSPEF